MRLIVFLHGTVLMHSAALGRERAERVAQVIAQDPTIRDYAGYVPVDGAAACPVLSAGFLLGRSSGGT